MIILLIILLLLFFVLLLLYIPDKSLVIVSAHYNEDLEWLKKSKWPVIICDKPGAASSSFIPDKSCTIDVNRGREASSYLKYIVENYDNLPEKIVFLHGHEETVHQKYPGHLLQAIEDAKTDEFDFISLNNWIHLKKDSNTSPNIPVHQNSHEFGDHPKIYEEMRENWESLFRPILGVDIPEYFRFDASAQFIVSKRAIYRHRKETYQRLYDFMVDPTGDEWARAVALEFIWHMLFTGGSHDICNDPKDVELYTSCNDEAYIKSRFNF